ncbi:glycoside hydrolase family protein [Pontiella agarivorans]|uniref:Glycoside hydrolase family protein n=1 Tax=Pontiella agarivorans TaxID=3038953 RepID=A0ABU5MYA8_9BACT|nr:glycoside hydrolase family protein [Pontiella agarivorans]MDZ8119172.1 glycoside hydrolase family protein [Pontiella agarivorans]
MKHVFLIIFISVLSKVSVAEYNDKYVVGCKLPADAVITCPDSNPLRDALLPVPETAVFEMEGWALWDPSLIKVGDTYHLFCSRWSKEEDHKAPRDAWKKSHIIRATSKNLFGPYEFQEVVAEAKDHPWAKQGLHNPKITKVGDRFLLYHLGIPRWQTGFMFSDSVEGPWTPVSQPIVNANNPALLIRDDGSAYMLSKFKRVNKKTGQRQNFMRAHEAADVNGPYTTLGDGGNRLPYDLELEDPTIWWANDQYNVICTDWMGKVTGIQKSVVYYTSKDGIHYELYSTLPVWSQNDPIPMEGGDSRTVYKVERPQVYVNDNGELEALLVSVAKEPGKHDYIVIRPVDHFVPAN